jgi:hypothetical protein
MADQQASGQADGRVRYGDRDHQTLDPVIAERMLRDLFRSHQAMFGTVLRNAILADREGPAR